MNRADLRAALSHPNVAAFLRVIRESESRQDDSGYRLENDGTARGRVLPDYAVEHPSKGLKSPPGRAFGAYQFLASTWAGLVKRYGFTDMHPASQDEAAVALIAGRGALDEVMAGDIEGAFLLLEKEWTSLPGGAEENALTARARETYLKWGGYLSAAPVDPAMPYEDTLATEHYGEAVTESTINPVPSADEQEANMAPFLAAALPALINAAPDLIRLFGKGERSQQNAVIAEKVGAVAMQVTGAINEQAAAKMIETDPAAARAFRAEVAENFDQWMGMVARFHAMDEASRDKARSFAMEYSRHPVAGKLVFPELLSLIFVVVAAIGGGFVLVDPYNNFNTEMQTAVVMLMLIGGWNGVKEFWFGSSMGSMRKDERNTNQEK